MNSTEPNNKLPPAAARVVLLIDESDALGECIAGGTKSMAESIATAVNSLLNQLSNVPDLEIAIAGYRNDGANGADVGCRWSGALTGQRFVPTHRLAANPASVEERVRRLPAPNAAGEFEEKIKFPIWYMPKLAGGVFPVLGYGYCQHLVLSGVTPQTPWIRPPLVISFVGDWISHHVELAVERVLNLNSFAGPPMLMHVHLGGVQTGRPMLYPSTDMHMTTAPQKVMFRWTSVLPDYMVTALRDMKVSIVPGARAMIYNATVADLIRMLGLVKVYAAHRPSANPPAVSVAQTMSAAPVVAAANGVTPNFAQASAGSTAKTGKGLLPAGAMQPRPALAKASAPSLHIKTFEPPPIRMAAGGVQRALLVVLLDRGITDASDQSNRVTWSRLLDYANDHLAVVLKKGQAIFDVAFADYGLSVDGQTELRGSFGPRFYDRPFIAAEELFGHELRVVESMEKIPNGIGGIISFKRKRAIYVEAEPTAAGGLRDAFAAANDLVALWRSGRAAEPFPAIVVHLTCAAHDAAPAVEAAESLLAQGTLLYHHVVTESPHRSFSCPASDRDIASNRVSQLWAWTSPLVGAERLAREKRVTSPAARGMVVNAQFELLLDGVLAEIATDQQVRAMVP